MDAQEAILLLASVGVPAVASGNSVVINPDDAARIARSMKEMSSSEICKLVHDFFEDHEGASFSPTVIAQFVWRQLPFSNISAEARRYLGDRITPMTRHAINRGIAEGWLVRTGVTPVTFQFFKKETCAIPP